MVQLQKVLGNCEYYPEKINIFKAFSMNIEDIRVIILGIEPDENSNGLAYSSVTTQPNTGLKVLLNEIERTYFKGDFDVERITYCDYNLLDWHNQGVFLLNISLTVERGIPNSHLKYWSWFTKAVITYIEENSSGKIWCIWNPLNYNINGKFHYLITRVEESFKSIDDILIKMNGQSIKWSKFIF